jgi:hypothetical protein
MGLFDFLRRDADRLNPDVKSDMVDDYFGAFSDIARPVEILYTGVTTYAANLAFTRFGDEKKSPILKGHVDFAVSGLGFDRRRANGKIRALTAGRDIVGVIEAGIIKVESGPDNCGEIDFHKFAMPSTDGGQYSIEMKFAQEITLEIPSIGLMPDKLVNITNGGQPMCTINVWGKSPRLFTGVSTGITSSERALLTALALFESTIHEYEEMRRTGGSSMVPPISRLFG